MKILLDINADWKLPAIIIVGSIPLFLICRELLCWYFKINEMRKNQDRIIYILTKILVQQGGGLDEEDKKAMKY